MDTGLVQRPLTGPHGQAQRPCGLVRVEADQFDEYQRLTLSVGQPRQGEIREPRRLASLDMLGGRRSGLMRRLSELHFRDTTLPARGRRAIVFGYAHGNPVDEGLERRAACKVVGSAVQHDEDVLNGVLDARFGHAQPEQPPPDHREVLVVDPPKRGIEPALG